jgi:hypothetical protein
MAGAERRLGRYVHVVDENGAPFVFGPDDKVPAWAGKVITNPAAWADRGEGADPAPTPASQTPAPSSAPLRPPPAPAGVPVANYKAMNKAELLAEIDRRNTDREADDQVEVEGEKNADLVAALVADDALQADKADQK